MTQDKNSDLVQRKSDHIEVVLRGDVGFGTLKTGFDAIQFEHCALPEMALSDVNLSSQLLGKPLKAPLLISSMTGGPEKAALINQRLSVAAEELGIALGVGSQRVALEDNETAGLSASIRKLAPTIPLFGNIGAAQLRDGKAVDRVRALIDMIEADGLFVHVNPLQEAIQPGGDTDWTDVLKAIESLAEAGLPIIVKEVGFGLSASVLTQLSDIGVTMFDIAGAGGTNWARVEGARAPNSRTERIAAAFTQWGIPTARAVLEARRVCPTGLIIASGGIKDGVDVAKAIRLGADIVGQAAATLAAAVTSEQAVIDHFSDVIETLRVTCFCTGSKSLSDLREAILL